VQRFVEESDRYSPRQWAIDNISCQRSTENLNRVLRMDALSQGRPWTRDAVPMKNDLFPGYLSTTSRSRALAALDMDMSKHYLDCL